MSATICTMERFRVLRVTKAVHNLTPNAPKMLMEMAVEEGIRALESVNNVHYAVNRARRLLKLGSTVIGGDAA